MAMQQVLRLHALNQLDEANRQNALRHRILVLAVLEDRRRRRQRQQNQRKPRSCWQRLWIARRPMLGQYDNIFELLDHQLDGDYRRYLGLDRDLFAELVRRVSPRIRKSPKYVNVV